MANAVEQSTVVLVCYTKKYKESAACRTEAEYAFTLKKPIIPLKMEKDYIPDGWYSFSFLFCWLYIKLSVNHLKKAWGIAGLQIIP